MVFGELLGGALGRAGERFNEERLRKQRIEDWRMQQDLALQTDFLTKNWANMTPEQQEASIAGIAPLVGRKPKDLSQLIGGVRAVGSIIPPQYMQPEALPAAPPSSIAVKPSLEAPVTVAGGQFAGQSIAAPASIELSQVPQPGATGTPSIYQPISGHRAVLPLPLGQPTPALRAGEQIMSQTPTEVIERRKADEAVRLRQQKVDEIMNSDMTPEDKALAIKALHIPAAVIAAQERQVSSPPPIGLSTFEIVSPNGKKVLTVQATRTGQLIETGSGQVINPQSIAGWTKRHVMTPYMYTTPESTVGAVNREEIARRGLGSVVGEVPEARVAETLIPETTPTGQITSMRGSRTGRVQAAEAGPGGAPRYKGAMSEGAQQTRGQIQVFQDSLARIGPLVDKHPEVVGRVRGNIEKGMAWVGWSKEEVDDLIGELNTVKATYTYMVSGKQINEAEQARLAAVMPDIGMPPARLKNNLTRFKRIVDTMAQVREMGRDGGATPAELAAADRAPMQGGGKAAQGAAEGAGGGGLRVTLPNGKVYNFKTKEEADKFRTAAGIK